MFIAACPVGCVKLRRSGMNGAGDHDRAGPDHAAPTELGSAFEGRRGSKTLTRIPRRCEGPPGSAVRRSPLHLTRISCRFTSGQRGREKLR